MEKDRLSEEFVDDDCDSAREGSREWQRMMTGRLEAINVVKHGFLGLIMQKNRNYLRGFREELEALVHHSEKYDNLIDPAESGEFERSEEPGFSDDKENVVHCSLMLNYFEYKDLESALVEWDEDRLDMKWKTIDFLRQEPGPTKLYEEIESEQIDRIEVGHNDGLDIMALMAEKGFKVRLTWDLRDFYALEFYSAVRRVPEQD